jgi:hypothetical protein
LNNCGKFRAVRDISVAPLEASDHSQIVKMMDDENGVSNRNGKRKPNKKTQKEDKKALLSREPSTPDQFHINIPPSAEKQYS